MDKMIGIANDISDGGDLSRRLALKRGPKELRRLGRVFDRMFERLEQSFTAESQFVSDASHELRTPITIIRGHLEVMDTNDPADVHQTKDIALDELHRMSLLVNDLVTLAQANSTDFVNPKPTDITTLMQDITAKAAALGPRDWTLKANAEGTVHIDPARITQAMLQLCANAVKFSEPGTPVELGATSRLSFTGTTELVLWVADAGIGIAPEHHQIIFKRFGRDSNNSKRAQGSGLGLNIVSAIATAHQGSVHVESAPGQGSIFILTIPQQHQPQSQLAINTTGTLEPSRFSDQEYGR